MHFVTQETPFLFPRYIAWSIHIKRFLLVKTENVSEQLLHLFLF